MAAKGDRRQRVGDDCEKKRRGKKKDQQEKERRRGWAVRRKRSFSGGRAGDRVRSWCENMGVRQTTRERERGTRGARGESRGAFKIWLVEEAERTVR